MAKSDPREFLLNTDYEMDKIIYFAEGELNSGQYDVPLTHNLGFAPLIFGVCAFNSSFSDSRSIPYNYQTSSDFVSFTARASNSDVKISYNTANGTPAKIYYRLYGFEPADSHAKVGATSKYAQNFILNTDYNYCKLYKKGTTTPTSTVAHNLGYIPQVLAWADTGTVITPLEESTTSGNIIVTDQNVLFQYPALGLQKIHYRIYYDEA